MILSAGIYGVAVIEQAHVQSPDEPTDVHVLGSPVVHAEALEVTLGNFAEDSERGGSTKR